MKNECSYDVSTFLQRILDNYLQINKKKITFLFCIHALIGHQGAAIHVLICVFRLNIKIFLRLSYYVFNKKTNLLFYGIHVSIMWYSGHSRLFGPFLQSLEKRLEWMLKYIKNGVAFHQLKYRLDRSVCLFCGLF